MKTLKAFSNKYFKEYPKEINSFESDGIPLKNFKEFNNLELRLNDEGFTLVRPKKFHDYGIQMGEGLFQLQCHNVSVEEHIDSVESGLFFGVYIISNKMKVRTYYEQQAVFRYSDIDNLKKKQYLTTETLLVFNPKKKHSLTYFGNEVTLALFDCFKLKN